MISKQPAIIIFFLLFFIININCQKLDPTEIYSRTTDAVVQIYTYRADNSPHGMGSGVILKKRRWIITNYHILGDASYIFAEHKGKLIKLDSILAVDPVKDIMILTFNTPGQEVEFKNIPDIPTGDSKNLKIGQRIYTIGSPSGFENTISEGLISGLRPSKDTAEKLIQISAPISPGSSGGALLDDQGELIGLNSMVISGRDVQNLNFAIPLNAVIDVANMHKALEPALKSKNEKEDFYFQKGYSDFLAQRYQSAIINYEKAIPFSTSGTRSATLYYYKGLAFDNMLMYDSAIISFNNSIRYSKISGTYFELATVYSTQKNYPEAIENFQQALVLDSGYVEAYLGLAKAFYLSGNVNEAMTVLSKVLGMKVESPAIDLFIAQMSLDFKLYSQAISCCKAALTLNPNYAEAYLTLADAYLATGKTEEAAEAQQNAYRLKPSLRNKKNNTFY